MNTNGTFENPCLKLTIIRENLSKKVTTVLFFFIKISILSFKYINLFFCFPPKIDLQLCQRIVEDVSKMLTRDTVTMLHMYNFHKCILCEYYESTFMYVYIYLHKQNNFRTKNTITHIVYSHAKLPVNNP